MDMAFLRSFVMENRKKLEQLDEFGLIVLMIGDMLLHFCNVMNDPLDKLF